MLLKVSNFISGVLLMFFVCASKAIAATDDPLEVSKDFSDKVLSIVQGPVIKILAAVVLLVGIASLLQGKHKTALCCGTAFLLLLFLPILLGRV